MVNLYVFSKHTVASATARLSPELRPVAIRADLHLPTSVLGIHTIYRSSVNQIIDILPLTCYNHLCILYICKANRKNQTPCHDDGS